MNRRWTARDDTMASYDAVRSFLDAAGAAHLGPSTTAVELGAEPAIVSS
jgi:hypothetical protein